MYCAITGYGQDGPYRDRSGHDMNYLGLVGLLGLTGDAEGAPIQAAGQIADLGGGALMAAFGILAALRERDRSGEGQLVDVSMADGALSWLAMVAAQYFADGVVPKRGEGPLNGGLLCYRPYRCADGWVTLGALEPKFFGAWCRGVGREDLIEQQFERPGSPAHAEVEQVFLARTRDEWQEFASEHDCCLEPVLDLDEALDVRARARARDGRRARPARRGAAGAPARRAGEARPHARRRRTAGPGPALGEHTDEVLRGARLRRRGDRRAEGGRRRRRAGGRAESQGSFLA